MARALSSSDDIDGDGHADHVKHADHDNNADHVAIVVLEMACTKYEILSDRSEGVALDSSHTLSGVAVALKIGLRLVLQR